MAGPASLTYGIMYGMKRTTIYLPEPLKALLEQEASRRGVAEAEIVRQAVDKELRRSAPRAGLVTAPSVEVHGANLHEHMEGFGEM